MEAIIIGLAVGYVVVGILKTWKLLSLMSEKEKKTVTRRDKIAYVIFWPLVTW